MKRRTLKQINELAFGLLCERLGPADTLRFFGQYEQGRGDYARDRHQWLDRLSKDDVKQLMLRANKQLAKGKRK